jgi:hypothetical protein
MYPGTIAAIQGNLKAGGLKAFYTGFTATILRDIPWNTLSFFFFNIFKNSYEALMNSAPSQRDTMAIGATGGALAAVIMTPIDVVKTRLMLQKPGADGKLPYQVRPRLHPTSCLLSHTFLWLPVPLTTPSGSSISLVFLMRV